MLYKNMLYKGKHYTVNKMIILKIVAWILRKELEYRQRREEVSLSYKKIFINTRFSTRELQVIKHELSMGGTLDFNFQQGVMGTVQVSDGNVVGQNGGVVSQNTGVVVGTTTGNAPAGVYVSTNAATPAATPSWVH